MTRARDVANLIGSGNFSSTTFTATAGQTAFTISHTQGFVQVFMNGLLLDETADYTSNGTAITLTSGAAAGDEIEVVSYDTFSVGDAIPTSGGTFTGAVTASNGLTVDDDGATPLTVDRATSNGTIIDVQKDGTSVGTIGANGSNLYIGSPEGTDAYIGFGNNIVRPVTSAGASRDNAIDLGYTGMRFKDLYLSGGAYIGGTGAANKLDDYEEGTFTGTLIGYHGNPSSTVTTTGYYTKIGNVVEMFLAFENANTTGASGDMWVTGLPFAHSGPYTVQSCSMNSAGTYPNSSPLALVSGTICYFYKHTSNGVPTAVYHNAGTSRAIRVTGSYRVA